MTDALANAAPAAATAADENILLYTIPGNEPEVQMQIDLTKIPASVRLDFLKGAVLDYAKNAVNQAKIRHNKANAPFEAYAAATAADPLQTAVPKPEGEAAVLDLIPTATAARDRLYSGEIRRMGGEPKARATVDPLAKMITDAVVRELHTKQKAVVQGYKWTDAVKEVGNDGLAYLNAKIDALVEAGGDRAALEKFRDTRYVAPAEMMLGRKNTKVTEGVSLL